MAELIKQNQTNRVTQLGIDLNVYDHKEKTFICVRTTPNRQTEFALEQDEVDWLIEKLQKSRLARIKNKG